MADNLQKEIIIIMKNLLKITFISILTGILLFACSKDDGEIHNTNTKQESKNISKFVSTTKPTSTTTPTSTSKVLGTCCYINGTTLTESTRLDLCGPNSQAVVAAGSIEAYQYVNNNGTPSTVVWTVLNANPSGSIRIKGTGANVTVSYAPNFISGSFTASGSGGTSLACTAKLNVTSINPSPCTASIYKIWCSPGGLGYNVMINVLLDVSNPFSHPATALLELSPDYLPGLQIAGGSLYLSEYSTGQLASEFLTTATTSTEGFYIPLIVKYIDTVTNETCIIKLTPLVTGDCNKGAL
jgi:hypothetical protein